MAAREGLFVPPDGTQGMSPADGRLALGGLLTPKGPSTLDIRPGILYGPGTGGNEPGRVTGTGGWQYSVAAGHFVGLRSAGGGPYLFSLDGATLTPAVAAAPASGSRFDLIWVRQRDFSLGDADSQAVVGVTSGVAGGTPTKPYDQVPAGALVLAEAEVKAGATSTSHANVTITPVARFTVPRGCAIPVRNQAERDELTGYPGLRVRRLDTKSTEEWDNGAWGLPPDIAAITGRLNAAESAWQSYTPAVNFTLGNGSVSGRYKQIGKTVHFSVELTMGSTTALSAGGSALGLPVPTTRRETVQGAGMRMNTGGNAPVFYRAANDSLVFMYDVNGTSATPTSSFGMALVAGATVRLSGTYEVP